MKNFTEINRALAAKKNFNLFKTLLVLGVLIINVSQVWAGQWTYSLTFCCIPKDIFGDNAEYNNMAYRKIYVDFIDGKNNHKEAEMTGSGYYYNGNEIYSATFNDCQQEDGSAGGAKYIYIKLRHAETYATVYGTLGYDDWKEMSTINGHIRTKGGWDTYGRDITIYGVPKTMDGTKWNEGSHTLYANFKVGDSEWKKQQMTKTSFTYAGNPIYKCTMLIKYNVIKQVEFIYNDGSDKSLYSYTPGSQYSTDDIDGKIFRGWINLSHKWSTYEVDHTIAAGSTIVWDLGQNWIDNGNNNWTNVYLYKSVNSSSGDPSGSNEAYSPLGSSTQYAKTYNSAVNYIGAWLFRNNTSNWNAHTQTTNIDSNVSGLTLYTYCNTESSNKLDWQVTTGAKKGTSGRTIYFDDTNTNWKDHETENREIYFNYGVDWDGGGYHRKIDFAVEKVPGTANLYKLKASSSDATNTGATNSSGQFDHDIYFQKWYVSKYYGYTNHNPITDSHVLERTEIYTDAITSNDFTLIPTTKQAGGSGTDGSPYIWNTTKMTGHTHTVTVSATHGMITLSYTDEGNVGRTPTVSTDVAHTCNVSASQSPDNGYDLTSFKLGANNYTANTNVVVRQDTTFSAVYTAHTYNIALNAGDHGSADGSATVVFNTSALATSSLVTANAGYTLDGYYDGSTKVLSADGSFADTNVSGYITSGKWSKYDSDAELTAKYTPITFTIAFDANGGEGEMANQSFTYDDAENLTANAFTKAGYYFEGWAESSEGAVVKRDKADGCTLSTTNGATKTLYAIWKSVASIATDCWDKDDNYKCGAITNLATPKPAASASWSSVTWGGTPSLTTDVVIPANMAMTVDEDHAQAKSISLGSSSTLSIDPNKGLEVVGTITMADGSAPTASDLILESSSAGNATLIFDNSNSAAATVQMYSKATNAGGGDWQWQYIASPFAASSVIALYNYYGGYLYKWNNGWVEVGGSDYMEPFVGYCATYPGAHTYDMEGTMAPTTSVDITVPAGKNWVAGNSWTAPIQIEQMTAADFEKVEATIYLFNTGHDEDGTGGTGTAAGTYRAVTPETAGTGTLPSVISSMQGFYVAQDKTNYSGKNGTLKLSYSKHVRPSGGRGIANGAMYAPKRVENEPDVMKIVVEGSRYNSDVMLFVREDFSQGYDVCWDGRNINDPGVGPLLYTLREDGTKDAISAIPTYEGAVIGFEAGEDDEYTFRFTYDGEDNWYLNDTKMNQSTLITSENVYRFDVSSDDKTRFVISATPCNAPAVTTGVGETNEGAAARKLMIDGMLYIVRSGRIYNAEGAVVK